MKIIREGIDAQKQRAISDYKKYASSNSSTDTIDEWALNKAASNNSYDEDDLRDALEEELSRKALVEASLGDEVEKAADKLDAEVEEVDEKGELQKLLDRKLRVALWKNKKGATSDFPNVLIVSDPGFGKTEIIEKWAAENNINLFKISLSTSGPETFGGIVGRDTDDPQYAASLGTKSLNVLDQPRSVLFLDEYNRAKLDIRGMILTLVQNHQLPDPRSPKGMKFFPNFLFTIAAMNPDDGSDEGALQLGGAEKNRFDRFTVSPSKTEYLRYISGKWKKDIEEEDDDEIKRILTGQLGIAQKILSDKRFQFTDHTTYAENQDDPEFNQTSYRSFKMALESSDGTKSDFINQWNHFCDYHQKHLIEDILVDYVDVDDKANAAVKNNPFGGEDSLMAKVLKGIGKL